MAEDEGRIFFFRKGMLGAARQPEIQLNGEVVGRSVTGGFFFVDRPAGSYEASCSTEAERRLSLTLEAGETRYVRSTVHMGIMVGRVHLAPADPEDGRTGVESCKYIGEDEVLLPPAAD